MDVKQRRTELFNGINEIIAEHFELHERRNCALPVYGLIHTGSCSLLASAFRHHRQRMGWTCRFWWGRFKKMFVFFFGCRLFKVLSFNEIRWGDMHGSCSFYLHRCDNKLFVINKHAQNPWKLQVFWNPGQMSYMSHWNNLQRTMLQ